MLDRSTGRIRLRATEPTKALSQAARFEQIFRPLRSWVQQSSHMITDFSVDKDVLFGLGFQNVSQFSLSQEKRTEKTNSRVMEYLKSVVPKMFQVSNVAQPFLLLDLRNTKLNIPC